MQFKIQQLALVLNPELEWEAMLFLKDCGISDWVRDNVKAYGSVRGNSAENVADLQFNYAAFDGNELEILRYVEGRNWIGDGPTVSHLGMHVTEDELMQWRRLMAKHDIRVAQEVWTEKHTNPRIADCRRYHYVIFDTRYLIGVDMKFIVRRIIDEAEERRQLRRVAGLPDDEEAA